MQGSGLKLISKFRPCLFCSLVFLVNFVNGFPGAVLRFRLKYSIRDTTFLKIKFFYLQMRSNAVQFCLLYSVYISFVFRAIKNIAIITSSFVVKDEFINMTRAAPVTVLILFSNFFK